MTGRRLGIALALAAGAATAACDRPPGARPTAAPFAARWTARQVVDAFAAAGLPVAGARAAGEDEKDWHAASAMVIPLPATPGPWPDMAAPTVRVYAFDDEQAMWHLFTMAHLSRNYLPSTFDRRATPPVFGWAFVVQRDNVVVDMGSDIDVDLAARFEAALLGLGAGSAPLRPPGYLLTASRWVQNGR